MSAFEWKLITEQPLDFHCWCFSGSKEDNWDHKREGKWAPKGVPLNLPTTLLISSSRPFCLRLSPPSSSDRSDSLIFCAPS